MVFLRKYNGQLANGALGLEPVYLKLRKAGSGTFAIAADWTPGAGDVKVSLDGAAEANILDLPAVVTGTSWWAFTLRPAELACRSCLVSISDPALDDVGFVVETFGNVLAAYPGDYTDPNKFGIGLSAQDWTQTRAGKLDFLTGDAFVRLGVPNSATVVGDIAGIAAKTNNLPSNPAAVGSAMTLAANAVTAAVLASGAVDADALDATALQAIANGLLDLIDAIEAGVTLRKALRLIGAATVGDLAGAGSPTETMKAMVTGSKIRITAPVDSQGNRTGVTVDST